jgi:magnesium chelatase subunit I
LKHEDEKDAYERVLQWFFDASSFELFDDGSEEEYRDALNKIKPLDELITTYAPKTKAKDILFLKEFILWALVEYKKLNKQRITKGFAFKDTYGAYLSNL